MVYRSTELPTLLGLMIRVFVPCGGFRWIILTPRDLAEIYII